VGEAFKFTQVIYSDTCTQMLEEVWRIAKCNRKSGCQKLFCFNAGLLQTIHTIQGYSFQIFISFCIMVPNCSLVLVGNEGVFLSIVIVSFYPITTCCSTTLKVILLPHDTHSTLLDWYCTTSFIKHMYNNEGDCSTHWQWSE